MYTLIMIGQRRPKAAECRSLNSNKKWKIAVLSRDESEKPQQEVETKGKIRV